MKKMSETQRVCKTCLLEKPLEDYPKAGGYRKGRVPHCLPCHRVQKARRMREARRRRPTLSRETNLKHRFGLSLEDYVRMLAEQGGACAGCGLSEERLLRNGKPQSLSVDHVHETGRIRGIVCNGCNRAVGLAGDDPKRLLAVRNYLLREPTALPAPRVWPRGQVPHRSSQLKCRYGITLDQYEYLEAFQGGVCAACLSPETRTRKGRVDNLAVDHDHETGQVRGLSCTICNRIAGLVDDDPRRLETLVDYLSKHTLVAESVSAPVLS